MTKSYKIGMVVGVFDLFHVGHLNLLERCKKECDFLIVGVLEDNYVRNFKHKEPIFHQKDRMRIIEAIRYVNQVAPITTPEALDKTKLRDHYDFNVLFAGSDWQNSDRYNQAKQALSKLGVKIKFFPYTEGISTTTTKQKIQDVSSYRNLRSNFIKNYITKPSTGGGAGPSV